MSNDNKFDRNTWQRFVRLAKPFLVSEQKYKAFALLFLLAAFSMSASGLNVLMSYVGRDFMTALSLKEKDEFIKHLYRYLGAFVGATLIVVFYRYTEERFGLMWRRWLSLKLVNQYFVSHAYYKINFFQGIDNPDQRIEEDIRSFTSQTLSFLLIIFNSVIALFAFMGILWSISSYLGIAAIGYATLGSIATYFLGKPLIGLNFAQLKKEADYRYKLINVRDNAESIAFFRGEQAERTRVRQRLKIALTNLRGIVDWSRNLNFFTTGYNYVVSILPTVVVAPLYLDGKIEFGVVTQAGMAFAHVLGALSIIVLNFGSLSAYAAVVRRLGSFADALDQCIAERPPSKILKVSTSPHLVFEDLTIATPDGDRKIVRNLSLDTEGKWLLITGASGSGKSSVLRVIAGIWTSGSGVVLRPPLEESFFIPQRPYMPLGTFRSQLLYPVNRRGVTDTTLLKVLRDVRLETTLERVGGFDAMHDWPNMLSTGEQQRLAFARLVLARPKYVYLDESTTALDMKNESLLYALLEEFAVSVLSVGYRGTLASHHHTVLELSDHATWRVEKGGRI